MIVVDTNVDAYLLIPGQFTEAARATLVKDPKWAAPMFWRSEFRNILSLYVRKRELSLAQAVALQETAESLLTGREYVAESEDVLSLAAASARSAYDCEFVAVARRLKRRLVTSDKQLLASFPEDTVPLVTFAT
ncbi:MAG: type II toxin-antitoxin system VapC family toxin [Gemmatimonadota bacterium]